MNERRASPATDSEAPYRKRVNAWCLYDWANSAFATTVMAALLPIFYAGGTARRDISSADLVADLGDLGVAAELAPDRPALISRLAHTAEPGDLILVMGARDPSLTDLCRALLASLGEA